jgi:hypothetical protein
MQIGYRKLRTIANSGSHAELNPNERQYLVHEYLRETKKGADMARDIGVSPGRITQMKDSTHNKLRRNLINDNPTGRQK